MGQIAINGFGRIGRVAFRVLFERGLHKSVVAVNDLTDAATLAHLLQYDSNYGRLKAAVTSHTYENKPPYTGALVVNDHAFYVLSEKDPAALPWSALKVDLVIESSGRFTDSVGMEKHIHAGAKRVLLSAPADGSGVVTAVRGINDSAITAATKLVANASCTTNCISPVAAVILKEFGIDKAMMTTVHSYTQDQLLQDGPHKDLRRARAAAQNIVPTTTGATKAAAKAIPELEGIFNGLAIRVPTAVGSLSDFTFVTKKTTTVEAVNKALRDASQTDKLKGILEVTDAPLVSSDIVGSAASAIVDSSLTQVVGGNLVKVIAWYDNEWGYVNRLVDQVEALLKLEAAAPSVPTPAPVHTTPVATAAVASSQPEKVVAAAPAPSSPPPVMAPIPSTPPHALSDGPKPVEVTAMHPPAVPSAPASVTPAV
jgi:glyceraldehyde 3-phosphate dehydrogenase